MSGALDGIKILDFTRFQQGTFATVLLADMGAEIWKVEQPGGDPGRRLGVHANGFSVYFETLNRNKRSIVLDLRVPEAIGVVRRLAAKADVVAENFRPGVMERLGIGFEDLRKDNPRLVYAQGSMWGPEGPRASQPGYDNVAQAAGGLMMASRKNESAPDTPLRGTADQIGGMLLSHGILAALLSRERTGRGQRVDSSLYGSQIALQGIQYGRAVYSVPLATGGRAFSSFSYRAFCADAIWIAFGYLTGDFWPRMCRALDLEWMIADAKFGDPVDRAQNEHEFVEILDAQVASRTSTEWLERLVDADVPCCVVQDYHMISEDPQAQANDYVLRYETSSGGEVHAQGYPWSFSETPPALRFEAPATPGLHSSAILRDGGFTPEESAQLFACGAVQGS